MYNKLIELTLSDEIDTQNPEYILSYLGITPLPDSYGYKVGQLLVNQHLESIANLSMRSRAVRNTYISSFTPREITLLTITKHHETLNFTGVTRSSLILALKQKPTSTFLWYIVTLWNNRFNGARVLLKHCKENGIPARYYSNLYGDKILFKKDTTYSFERIHATLMNLWQDLKCSQRGISSIMFGEYDIPEGLQPQGSGESTTRTTQERVAPCEILQYSSKVEQFLQCDVNSKKTLFGIELELEGADGDAVHYIHDHLKKHAIMKRDGSLAQGVEIVSKPDTVENHEKAYKPFFDQINATDLEAKTSCGIHIHVSKAGLSFLALGRIVQFINHNETEVKKIAGRESSYAKLDKSRIVTSPWYAVNSSNKYSKDPSFSWDKYSAVNLAPRKTLEFRIFKSTTKYEEFMAFLQFTQAVVDYCKLAGDDNKGAIKTLKDVFIWKNFRDYVVNRASAYKFLVNRMKEQGVY